MEYKSHRVGGVCAGALVASGVVNIGSFSIEQVLPIAGIVTISTVGSLFPDIDHPNSKISRTNPLLAKITSLGLGIGKILTSIILLLCFWIPKSRKEQILKGFEHRGIFHTLLAAVMFSLLIGLIPYENIKIVQLAFFMGYMSHIFMDMLTVSGVRVLYPIINYQFHFPFIRLHTSNQLHEWIARIIFIIVTILLLKYCPISEIVKSFI